MATTPGHLLSLSPACWRSANYRVLTCSSDLSIMGPAPCPCPPPAPPPPAPRGRRQAPGNRRLRRASQEAQETCDLRRRGPVFSSGPPRNVETSVGHMPSSSPHLEHSPTWGAHGKRCPACLADQQNATSRREPRQWAFTLKVGSNRDNE